MGDQPHGLAWLISARGGLVGGRGACLAAQIVLMIGMIVNNCSPLGNGGVAGAVEAFHTAFGLPRQDRRASI